MLKKASKVFFIFGDKTDLIKTLIKGKIEWIPKERWKGAAVRAEKVIFPPERRKPYSNTSFVAVPIENIFLESDLQRCKKKYIRVLFGDGASK